MMKYLLPILLLLGLTIQAQSPTAIKITIEYQIITSVESLVPSGLGRSRLIAETENRDLKITPVNGRMKKNEIPRTEKKSASPILRKQNC